VSAAPPGAERGREPGAAVPGPGRERHSGERPSGAAAAGARAGANPLSIAVMLADGADAAGLVRALQRTRAQVRQLWPVDDIPVEGDVLFCQLTDDLPRRLPWLPGKPPMALVVVLPTGEGAQGPGQGPGQWQGQFQSMAQALRNCAPHGVLQLPASDLLVHAVLQAAREQFLYAGRMQRRIDKLDENLRTIRNVERAKSILIASRKLSEEEAYGFLRRKAMERRVSIGALASLIVDSEDLLA